jgi:hypothetical protein
MYKDADAGSGGGGAPTPQPSLLDLDDPNFKPIIPEGTGGNPPVEGIGPDGALLPGYEKDADGKVVKTSEPAGTEPEVEGLDKDGNILEGYERAQDGTIQKIVPTTTEENEDEPKPEEFWNAVNSITGREIEVDFGNVDPISPEGVALRENAIVESTEKAFDAYLRESNPRAYAYFLHTQAGGTDADFFGVGQPILPSREDFEANADAQAILLKQDLVDKGVPEDIAQTTVDKYVKDNLLTEKALAIYDKYQAEDKKQIELMEKAAAEEQAQFKQQVTAFEQSVADTIASKVNLVIPEAKRTAFTQFIKDNTRHSDGKFFFVQPVEATTLDKQIEALYFQFVKGDLKSLIVKQAKALTVQRLRANLAKDGTKNNSTQDDRMPIVNVPLSEVN